MSALFILEQKQMWKTRITTFDQNEKSGCYIYKKNVFDYILFHQLVLEIYDLGKSLFLLT